jgi:murein DD-endopeptidase MepM/ murein hydrolase activator NlpD
VFAAACTTPLPAVQPAPRRGAAPGFSPADPATWGQRAHEVDDLVFEGGHVHFEMRWSGGSVIQTARNDFLVPVTIAWQVDDLDNLDADTATSGVTVLPGAIEIGAQGPTEVLATFHILDRRQPFYRGLDFHAQFGDPSVQPVDYVYAIPFQAGEKHRVIQGMGGSFSHTGSNRYAIDFECPEGTPVVAARDGTVVALNDAATTHGTTEEFTSYAATNFVLISHDDGSIGQYMHFEADGVDVHAGQRVLRGDYIGRSGNTGFSTTPHLHFQLMTSADDGLGAVSFPFELLVAPRIAESPVEGEQYRAWESD